ncbi:MAG: aminotransferase class III-fold pyridoxal phosphate-dependent enzyme [Comamonadaceae bacterium]|nr:MAG: aminotransferase class III-fold pyridoxal phosphate-dependent enzyme [Comamonadaceae bacterium]
MSSEDLPTLTHGQGSRVHGTDGREWIDLVTGYGAVFLGHSHPQVTQALQWQAGRLIACGRYPTARFDAVEALLATVLPAGLRLGGFASSGMEAAEFAMRVAATHTGRSEFAGFGRSMHGKSAMTASLCWANAPVKPAGLHTLPFVDAQEEPAILEALERLLRARPIAALFIEPVQGTNGAHRASPAFYAEAIRLCHAHASLCVMDEILTGLYRTGPAFTSSTLAVSPDMLLFAKNMGNGFPVSAMALAPHVQVAAQALPGSTFAGNPLALTAVEATLTAMASLRMGALVQELERVARDQLGRLQERGIQLRGQGALWCLELDQRIDLPRALAGIRDAGILVTCNAHTLRLLPAATLDPAEWADACNRIADACLAARVLKA